MDLGLKGAKVLVTGSTKGIGRAIADTFAAEGANVGICARNQADVDAAVTAIKAKGVAAFGAAVDVSNGPALKAWVADMAAKLGGIDVVVANVSALSIGQDEESWEKEFSTDMMGTVRLVNAAMPFLEKSSAAAIVSISSVSGREVDFASGPYGTFKAAIIHYTQGLAYQLAAKGIRANCILPGVMDTPHIYQHITGAYGSADEMVRQRHEAAPMGRMGSGWDVAHAAVFLASDEASYITGVCLPVDGGLTARCD